MKTLQLCGYKDCGNRSIFTKLLKNKKETLFMSRSSDWGKFQDSRGRDHKALEVDRSPVAAEITGTIEQ